MNVTNDPKAQTPEQRYRELSQTREMLMRAMTPENQEVMTAAHREVTKELRELASAYPFAVWHPPIKGA